MTYRPHIAFEGPATSCIITDSNGVKHILGWTNCTPASFAMAIERSTLGRIRLTACSVRDKTGDVSGGTTLDQNAYVSQVLYGIPTDVHNGNNVAPPTWTAKQVQGGRPIVLQGNAGALVGTVHRSTQGRVNHAVYINEVRGGSLGSPAEALVYDPAADGRVAGWGTAAKGPQWWPWGLVLKFAAELQPWGDTDPRKLGAGKFYVAVFPDTDGAIWGPDVSTANRAVDPDGRIAGAAVQKAGHNYGTLVDTADLKAALTKIGHNYGSVVDPSDVQFLINWATAH